MISALSGDVSDRCVGVAEHQADGFQPDTLDFLGDLVPHDFADKRVQLLSIDKIRSNVVILDGDL